MSQSLIIFNPSGKVEYQFNNKITPFNDFISTLINETQIDLDQNFTTDTINQKRFYCYHKENIYVVLYFDAITTINSDKIKQALIGIYKTYRKFEESDDLGVDKFRNLVDLQFNILMKSKQTVEEPASNKDIKGSSNGSKPQMKQAHTQKQPSSKKMRKWDNSGEMVDYSDNQVLDYSSSQGQDTSTQPKEMKVNNEAAFTKDSDLVLVNELNDILNESDEDEEDEAQSKPTGFFGKIGSYFGGSIDVDEVSKKFNEQLISKNIAPSTAKTIIDKLKSRLAGKKVNMATYKQTLVDELTKILTPNVSTDLLYEIKRNDTGRPYVISVVGVNGVGKSTNLAKLAYWFLQNNLNVLICACDTFRSGAVEQLKVHVNNLDRLNLEFSNKSKIALFEKGYGSGDHVVQTAKSAIQYATEEHFDVMLIDTAGRTHSNAKLMAPLKKFGDAANPNKIIMVGEALVGTDSVEQAINFNNAFGNRRNLDFFIISKVDTVGDLVGTMINMVMATKVPILFVGTGQTYTDIKRLSVKQVVDMLTK
ncbi:Srp101 protein [Candida orthopsilosis Co 90-125]|uniref:Signal recognition particle receptor subunit alpha homolog n=1 Tax=Candida orthopsilosis (strain 90-125) TaxID=1136231 RepID=H8X0W4_CANO9|nr:Srp101 protein [Candida orthopsilosis Co 90-125]CCG22003.1 Srp101 protein [Candida orthopsilosis Co 90-125]